jgi:hypothetical protein
MWSIQIIQYHEALIIMLAIVPTLNVRKQDISTIVLEKRQGVQKHQDEQ